MKNVFLITMVLVSLTACKRKQAADNRTMVMADTAALLKNNASTDVPKQNAASVPHKTDNNSNQPVNREGGEINTTTAPQTAPVPQDKGWSDAAKGAAIGGGSGAVIGAVVSKNKAQGAIIGSVIGAGTGYAIGRSRDKKSGRVDRQKARRKARRTTN